MNDKKLLQLFGLKWNPFLPDVPDEALMKSIPIDTFCFSVENLVLDGGFALITGESGLGKSVALHILYNRLSGIRELKVCEITRPQSSLSDFYREMGAHFGVELKVSNRFGGFRGLREKFKAHLSTTLLRPIVIIDEAQETPNMVLKELRILSGEKFDSKNILTVVLSGDQNLISKLAHEELISLGTRIKTRLVLEPWTKEELYNLISFVIEKAGNQELMTEALMNCLSEQAIGSPRIMMNIANQILNLGALKTLNKLDEKLFFEFISLNKPSLKKKNR